MSAAVVLVSGGLDSCVTAALARKAGHDLLFLHVNYGQRTEARERLALADLADWFVIPEADRLVCDARHLAVIGGSSLTDSSIPVSHADLRTTEIPSSYVPFRNANILSIAVSWAEVRKAERIYIGAVYEDSSGYPDCRPAYFEAFNRVIRLGTAAANIRIETPIIHMSKAEIVLSGLALGAPLHLTWSCYQAEDTACGVCDSCALRLRGFARAGVEDPIEYALRRSYE